MSSEVFFSERTKKSELFIPNRAKFCCLLNASLVNIYMEDRYSYNFFKKRVIYELRNHSDQIRFI